ncbi:EthD family reductase [Cyclobacteriaceae bacterium]|nr:EthD family reductase [Cyclobacteriaceae bacterium]MDA9906480.1 EthD family reductase [Cyclobacteriaceae bacterium]MDC6484247.1 EthD family reductase [Cyclobacteriaceae bacterium]
MKLVVLYPQPKDVQKFNSDYNEHILFLNKKLNIPADMTAYEVTDFVSGPFGEPAYYKMWVMPFDSQEALNAALSTPEFQAVAADANRISNGGAPTLMIGA